MNSSVMNLALTADPLYEGFCAARAYAPETFSASYTQLMTRSSHFSRVSITKLKIMIPNFYVNSASGLVETATGSSATVTASVEYPSGTFTQIKFNGSTSGTIPSGSTIISDYVTVTIPNNTQFWIRMFWTNPSGVVYSRVFEDPTIGEIMDYAASGLTDKTMSGTVLEGPGGAGGSTGTDSQW
jgi:hypothetical protein